MLCLDTNSSGTGFLHPSGHVITAEHVIRQSQNILLLDTNGNKIKAQVKAFDVEIDLAILTINPLVTLKPLGISRQQEVPVGSRVATWGFPTGYNGLAPLLSVGYLSGVQAFRLPSGNVIQQWIVNAAFNSGNSGGPLLNIDTGEVIGVVSSKPRHNTTGNKKCSRCFISAEVGVHIYTHLLRRTHRANQ